MNTKQRLYEEQVLVLAKSIILDNMLADLFGETDYSEFKNMDKIKVHHLLRERGKLYNKPLS